MAFLKGGGSSNCGVKDNNANTRLFLPKGKVATFKLKFKYQLFFQSSQLLFE